ncbi:MAG TPA: NADH-quinone oxidoreductase subunit M, partial [Chloroflexi bacterium]|nr:NADH-quinone oxidoreductase subunit M [Chloroflexota bacterium]
MEFPFLSLIVFIPILAAIVILFLPKERGENARMLALAAMIFGLILSLFVYFGYQIPEAGTPWADSLQFFEERPWIPGLNINYLVGVDGLSATLVLLTAFVGLGGVLISWSIPDRPREFFAFFMLLVAGVQGVFVAVDAFLLFFFYELAVLPMYVLIVIWGWKQTREYAAMKLTLYLLIGSFVSFIAFLVLYFQLPDPTFDLRVWSEYIFPVNVQLV